VKRAVAALGGFALLIGAGLIWLSWPQTPPQKEAVVWIPPGEGLSQIAARLEQAGVVRAWRVHLAARLLRVENELKAGEYRFSGAQSVWQVLRKLARGEVVRHKITIPEGLRTDEVLALLARKTGIALARWQRAARKVLGEPWEGLLLPDTYDYARPLDPERFLLRLKRAQEALLRQLVGEDRARWQELRIVASIVEKETARDRERALVAAVIYNRLARGMPLQMDPTVIYGIWRTRGFFDGNLRRRDLQTDTPWNTYTRKGLPPTPICNPGKASLQAAAHPAPVDYLYFVADGQGGHRFAKTLAEHERNVHKLLQWERSHRRKQR